MPTLVLLVHSTKQFLKEFKYENKTHIKPKEYKKFKSHHI